MKHPLRDRLLASFSDTSYRGIITEYDTGLSGADVCAARFESPNKTGLNGTYIVKIVEEHSIEAEREFFSQTGTPELDKLLVPLCGVSASIDGFIATAYKVAFNKLESIRPLADILTTKKALPEEKVVQQIERLSEAFIDWHIEIDDIYGTATFYNLLELVLEKRRLLNINSRLNECLPKWPQDAPQIKFMDRIIINPLWYIQPEAWQKLETHKRYAPPYFTGRIHGDLHTGNIICYIPDNEQGIHIKSAEEQSTGHPKVIDFGQTNAYGFSLFDLAYLDFDIIQQVLRVNNQEQREQWFYLLDHVMDHILPEKELKWELNKFITWDTQRALKFILPLRRQVMRFITSMKQKDPSLGDAPEINWWFATIAAGLNFARKGKKEEQRPQENRQVALLYAAYGLKKLHEKLEIPAAKMDSPPFVSWAGMAHPVTVQPEMHMRERYLQALRKHKQERDEIDVVGLHINENMIDNRTKWPLTKIFVWPNVIEQRPDFDTLLQQDQMSHYSKQTGNAKKERQSTVTVELSLATVLAEEKQLLLFGNAGMGTSTILHYLLLQITQPGAEFLAQLPQLAGLVPVFIELEDYANKILKENKNSAENDIPISTPHPRLEDFISSYLQEEYPEYKVFIEQQIKEGNVLFLFSDLDAITDDALQEIVARSITHYTYFHRQNHFIVTSRPIAFRGISLYKDYATYALSCFTVEQIHCFLTQWLQVHNQQAEQVEAEVKRLWQAISGDNAVRQLVTTPLFLTIFALKQSANHITPFSRNDFFKHCKELLLRQKGKKNGREHLPQEMLCKVMYTIAFWMHELDTNKKQVSRDDLVREIELVLKAHNGGIQPEANPYIEFMRKKAGILRKCSAEHFDFTLKPIMEYLAAAHIATQEYLGQSSRHRFIQQHMHNPHWREVLRHVFALLLADKSGEDVDRAISDFRGKGMSLHDLIFIGQSLVDSPGHAAHEEEIILSIGYYYLWDDSDELRKKFAGFLRSSSETPLVEILKSTLRYVPGKKQPASRRNNMDPTADYKRFIHKCLELVYTGPIESLPQLEDDAPLLRIRTMMLLSLFNMQSPDWVPRTIELLNQPNESVAVKQAAIMLLGILGKHDEQAKERLLEALDAPIRSLRSAASNALSQLARERQDINIPQILFDSLVHTCSDKKKVAIIDTLALIGNVPEDVLDRLIEDFPLASSSVQRASVLATGEIGLRQPPGIFDWTKIRDFLLEVLENDEDPVVKSVAVHAIKTLASKDEVKQDKNLIDALLTALSDPDSQVKDTIAQALQCLGHPLLEDDLLPDDQV